LDRAVIQDVSIDKTYKARLAKAIKQELERGTHPADIKRALEQLIDRHLSPALLHAKVTDNLPKVVEKPAEDPYADFPEF